MAEASPEWRNWSLDHELADCGNIEAVRERLQRLLGEMRAYELELEIQNRELRDAQLALEQSRDRYFELFESLPLGYAVLDRHGVIREINLAAVRMLERERSHLAGLPFLQFVAQDDQPVFMRHLRRSLLREKQAVATELCLASKDGAWMPVELRSVFLGGQDGTLHTAITDIRERLRDREALRDIQRNLERQVGERTAALRESEAAFRAMFEVSSIGKMEADPFTGRFLRVNAAFCRLTGYSEQELLERTFPEITHPEDRDSGIEARNRFVAGDASEFEREKRYVRPDGSVVWALVTLNLVRDAEGQPQRVTGVIQEITKRRQAEAASREYAERERRRAEELEVLMGAVPAVVFISHDPACRSITGNRAAYELLRMPVGANLSKTSSPYRAPDHFQVFKDGVELSGKELPMQTAARGVDVRDFEEELRFDNGASVFLFGNAMPLRDREGRVRGAVGAFMDITARKRIEAKLIEDDRRKDEFLATLAHELRNPLASIRAGLSLLCGADLGDAGAARSCGIMDRQVNHLVRLVDDLLDVSRITSGRIELRKEQVDLATLFSQALEISQPSIEVGGHQVEIELPDEPLILDADPARLAQVFSNLLNNAAKYTEPYGRIRLRGRRQDGEAVVSVIDNGVGIPPEMLPRVFDLFAQVDRNLRRSRGGLGIGLALVRSLVELHGGRVEAHSEGVGLGSEFWVHLPLAAAGSAGASGLEAPEPPPAPSLLSRILIVDDNRDAADSLGMLFESFGATVQAVYGGADALEALEAFHPDVVLLDLGMPGMDGYEVARRIRQRPGSRRLTLIALTGWGQEEDRNRTREAGFDHHLVKPVDLDSLMPLLASLEKPVE
jgi:PAS domain S-box-containing protein